MKIIGKVDFNTIESGKAEIELTPAELAEQMSEDDLEKVCIAKHDPELLAENPKPNVLSEEDIVDILTAVYLPNETRVMIQGSKEQCMLSATAKIFAHALSGKIEKNVLSECKITSNKECIVCGKPSGLVLCDECVAKKKAKLPVSKTEVPEELKILDNYAILDKINEIIKFLRKEKE